MVHFFTATLGTVVTWCAIGGGIYFGVKCGVRGMWRAARGGGGGHKPGGGR